MCSPGPIRLANSMMDSAAPLVEWIGWVIDVLISLVIAMVGIWISGLTCDVSGGSVSGIGAGWSGTGSGGEGEMGFHSGEISCRPGGGGRMGLDIVISMASARINCGVPNCDRIPSSSSDPSVEIRDGVGGSV